MITCVDGQVCSNFHGTVQCYRQMWRYAVKWHSNFLHLVTTTQTALIMHCSYKTMLCYSITLHVCIYLYRNHSKTLQKLYSIICLFPFIFTGAAWGFWGPKANSDKFLRGLYITRKKNQQKWKNNPQVFFHADMRNKLDECPIHQLKLCRPVLYLRETLLKLFFKIEWNYLEKCLKFSWKLNTIFLKIG